MLLDSLVADKKRGHSRRERSVLCEWFKRKWARI